MDNIQTASITPVEEEACHNRILQEIQSLQTLENSSLLASGGVIAFSLSISYNALLFSLLLSLLFAAQGFLRSLAHQRIIYITTDYLILKYPESDGGSQPTNVFSYYRRRMLIDKIEGFSHRMANHHSLWSRHYFWLAMLLFPLFTLILALCNPPLFESLIRKG